MKIGAASNLYIGPKTGKLDIFNEWALVILRSIKINPVDLKINRVYVPVSNSNGKETKNPYPISICCSTQKKCLHWGLIHNQMYSTFQHSYLDLGWQGHPRNNLKFLLWHNYHLWF